MLEMKKWKSPALTLENIIRIIQRKKIRKYIFGSQEGDSTVPHLGLLLPTTMPKEVQRHPPLLSHETLCSESFKLGGVLGLSFKVYKMLQLIKPLLVGSN